MSVQEGFNRYACDVKGCTQKCYAAPGTDAAAGYVRKQYLDQNGQTREYVLCTDHAAKFDAIVRAHDADFAAFMKNGTMPSGVTTTTTTTDAKQEG